MAKSIQMSALLDAVIQRRTDKFTGCCCVHISPTLAAEMRAEIPDFSPTISLVAVLRNENGCDWYEDSSLNGAEFRIETLDSI